MRYKVLLFICVFVGVLALQAKEQLIPSFETVVFESKAEEKEDKISLYGQKIEMAKIRVEGTSVSWDEVRKHIGEVMPDSGEKTMGKPELKQHLKKTTMEQMHIFSKAVRNLANYIAELQPGSDPEMLEMIIADYLVVGNEAKLTQKYEKLDPEIGPKIHDAQEKHNKYLAMMLVNDAYKREK